MSGQHRPFRALQSGRRAFNPDSGLVFDEAVVAARPHHATWPYMTKGRVQNVRLFNREGLGAATMSDMLKRKLALHIPDLEPELLEGVDWLIMKAVWEYLQARDLVSLHAWKVFSQAYPNEECLKHHTITASMFVTFNNWASSLSPVTSPDIRFVTVLTISAVEMTRLDLLSLPDITNLGTLTIGENVSVRGDGYAQKGLDDAVLRSWSRRATEDGCFSQLRVLHLEGHDLLTPGCLPWVTLLPNLATFSIEGGLYARIDPELTHSLGWKFDRSMAHDQSSKVRMADTDGPGQSQDRKEFIDGSALHRQSIGLEKTANINSLPMLHVTIATSHQPPRRPLRERVCHKRESRALETKIGLADGKRKPIDSDTIAVPRQVRARHVQNSSTALAEFGL